MSASERSNGRNILSPTIGGLTRVAIAAAAVGFFGPRRFRFQRHATRRARIRAAAAPTRGRSPPPASRRRQPPPRAKTTTEVRGRPYSVVEKTDLLAEARATNAGPNRRSRKPSRLRATRYSSAPARFPTGPGKPDLSVGAPRCASKFFFFRFVFSGSRQSCRALVDDVGSPAITLGLILDSPNTLLNASRPTITRLPYTYGRLRFVFFPPDGKSSTARPLADVMESDDGPSPIKLPHSANARHRRVQGSVKFRHV